jgi:hypothetical protein
MSFFFAGFHESRYESRVLVCQKQVDISVMRSLLEAKNVVTIWMRETDELIRQLRETTSDVDYSPSDTFNSKGAEVTRDR